MGESRDRNSRPKLEAQFARVMSENGAAVGRLAWGYTNSSSDRDELVQDIAFAFWRALPTFRGECSERTFLFRIAHNHGIRHLSKRRALVSLDASQDEVEDLSPSAEDMLTEEQQSKQLERAIRTLPVMYQQVLMLSLEGLDYAEISQVLGISENNVGVRLNRARQLLRKQMAGGNPNRK